LKQRLLWLIWIALMVGVFFGAMAQFIPQPPQISSLSASPANAPAGQSFLLIVNGQNFCSGATVSFDSIPVQSGFISTNQLQASISGSLTLGKSGTVPVQVMNPINTSGCSSPGLSSNIVPYLIPGSLIIVTQSLPNGTVGTPYSASVNATGGLAPYNFSASGSFPPGLSLNSAGGSITGTPTQAGSFNFTVTVMDVQEHTASASYTVVIQPPTLSITTASLPNGLVNVPYSASIQATGGVSPYSWALLSGGPPGLALSTAGVLAGTPTQAGAYNLQVRVMDSQEHAATRTIPLTIQQPPLQVTTTSLPNAVAGTFYSAGLAAIGGTSPYTWSTSSTLPAGLTLSSAGVLSGTTQQLGSYPLSVTVRDSANQTAQAQLVLQVVVALQITTTTIPQGFLTTAYTTTFTAAGGTPPYQWSAPGGVPPGLTLDASSGILSGTLSQQGAFPFTVQVRDYTGQQAQKQFILVSGNALSITTGGLHDGTVGLPYEDGFIAAGGTAPYTWSQVGSGVPGLFLNPVSGALSGTPTQVGVFNMTVRVTDSLNSSSTRSYSVNIKPAFRIDTDLPPATLGVYYEQTLSASGGTIPYTWALVGTGVEGLTLNPSTGTLSGIPTQAGAFSFTITATDAASQQTSRTYSFTVNQAIRISPETIPNGATGTRYSQTFTAAGGTAPYNFLIAGSVPGLTMDPPTGVLSGTPTQAGTFQFSIRVTDSKGLPGTKAYTLVVSSALRFSTPSLPDAVERSSYSQTLAATGGTPPYSWRVSTGNLPDGLTLNSSTGVISGTPAKSGSVAFTLEVSDSTTLKATQNFSINVLPAVAVQSAGTLTTGVVGTPYSFTLSATGGTPPYRWRVRDGVLPDGLTLSDAGIISGTPGTAGRFSATLEVSDSAARTAAAAIIIPIDPPALRITSASGLPSATAGVDYQFTPVATGGTPPYQWALTASPAELQIDAATGTIRGRFSSSGDLSFTIRVSDSAGVTTTQDVTLRVGLAAAPAVTISGLSASSGPGQQLQPTVAIAQPYPIAVSGELLLTFDSAVNVDDPAVQFSTGGRRVVFNIPAGETRAVFNAVTPGFQTGTVAGTITVTARLSASGTDITPTPAPSQSLQIPKLAPVITSVRLNRTTAGFEVAITGYATGRELTSANIRFQTSGTVQGTEFTVNLAQTAAAWYQTADSRQFGSLATITIPFNVSGSSGSVTSVSATLTNSSGTSPSVSATF
jgi:hypothetical protein